jgi:hypothetical protein
MNMARSALCTECVSAIIVILASRVSRHESTPKDGVTYATLDHNKSLDYRKYSGIKARLLIGVMDFHTRGVIPIYLHISMSIYWAFEIRSCDLESID